jgi:hypothetical protein
MMREKAATHPRMHEYSVWLRLCLMPFVSWLSPKTTGGVQDWIPRGFA